MKYNVVIDGKTFEVEIEDINARPVVAVVNGVRVEVTPEAATPVTGSLPLATAPVASAPRAGIPAPAAAPGPISSKTLTAPLPGTVVEVFVKAGDEVESGQVVLVIEAMKMKNSIRSTRAGKAARVLVSAGQTVAHKQGLVEFE